MSEEDAGQEAVRSTAPCLVPTTKLDIPVSGGWWLNVYPKAGEAGGTFRWDGRQRGVWRSGSGDEIDVDRSLVEAGRRARGQVRRYCAANALNRLGTLTYGGDGCHDPRQLRLDMARFFRRLRRSLGGKRFPYLWVPEWHHTDHGLHAHFAVGRYIGRTLIEQAWGHGFVHIKLIGDLPVGSGVLEEARLAARYLAKYVSKDPAAGSGLHRYDLAQGFQPEAVAVWGRTIEEAIDEASRLLGRSPAYVWESRDQDEWAGPPAVWVSWAE